MRNLNLNFFRKRAKRYFVEIALEEKLRFFYILDDKMDFSVGIFSRNLATQSNFIRFRDRQNFTYFEASGVE